ncbi:MAG: divalent metal cation transporter [Cyclobacteriaceae bacterium]|nr:divalent metal cation transporter [Cyclobacteriaceae bacterium]
MNIGQALTVQFGDKTGKVLQWLIDGSVIGGCAAYEAGNILGAVSGLNLLSGVGTPWLASGISVAELALLWQGKPKWISNLMMALIAVMGLAFIRLAWMQGFSVGSLLTLQ